MDDQTINAIVEEIGPEIVGRAPGKLFQLNALTLAIDFRLRSSRYLLLSLEPAQPRLHLITRRVRDLEKASSQPSPFAQLLKKELSSTTLQSVEKNPGDRIVHFSFTGHDEIGAPKGRSLIAQLTGRTANLLMVDPDDLIIGVLRRLRGSGQNLGEKYEPPQSRDPGSNPIAKDHFDIGKFPSLSEALDAHFGTLAEDQAFDTTASSMRAQLRKEHARTEKLLQKLGADLASHGDAEQHRRIGDLLLANLSTAKRQGSRVKLIDYFADDAPTIEVEVDENSTLQRESARRFAAYARSKRAAEKINERIAGVAKEISGLAGRQAQLEKIIADHNEAALLEFTGGKSDGPRPPLARGARKPEKRIPGTRRYVSSDGYEILVGRAAHDNDHLTFKVAKPNDLWLHAADYPGSHVVVRNSTRKEIPHRTIIEAAQLAAYFSHARKDAKVVVSYAQRKFISKLKGAAPGLVRVSRSKSINVAPKESVKSE